MATANRIADPDELSDFYQHCGIPKPEPRKRTKGRKDRLKQNHVHTTHDYVFGRERGICRCCRKRPAESMHEMRFKSLGGKVSRRNSVATCGDGVRKCHGFLQRLEITYQMGELGAEDVIVFTPTSDAAADWMQIALGQSVKSEPMVVMEAAE